MKDKMKLYRVTRSFIDSPRFEDSVLQMPVYWYAGGRQLPIGKYEELIVGYDELSEDEKLTAQKYIDEWFTEQELSLVKPLIENLSYDLKTIEITTPVVVKEDGRLCVYPFEQFLIDNGVRSGELIVLGKEHHNLPFEIIGYCDADEGLERFTKTTNRST